MVKSSGHQTSTCADGLDACLGVARAAERLAGRSNLALASDLAVASRLAEGAAHGAAANVLVNLPSLGDPAAAAAFEAEAAGTVRQVVRYARATRTVVSRHALREPEKLATRQLAPAAGPSR